MSLYDIIVTLAWLIITLVVVLGIPTAKRNISKREWRSKLVLYTLADRKLYITPEEAEVLQWEMLLNQPIVREAQHA